MHLCLLRCRWHPVMAVHCAQVPPYFSADGSVHITQGVNMLGVEKAKVPFGRDNHFEQASSAPQHYAQPELMHPQHQENHQVPPHSAHLGHPPLPPGARHTYRGRQVELAQVRLRPALRRSTAWCLQDVCTLQALQTLCTLQLVGGIVST